MTCYRTKTRRYHRDKPVSSAQPGPTAASAPAAPPESAEGARPEAVRVGTWNIRWFPDGEGPPPAVDEVRTDLDQVVQTLVRLELDIVALQEIKSHNAARAALERVIERLNRRTGRDYRLALDDCAGQNHSHLALLYDMRRARAEQIESLDDTLLGSEHCTELLRPALYGRFRIFDGTALNFVAIHLVSGKTPTSASQRSAQFEALPALVARVQQASGNPSVIVAGDFNTIGRDGDDDASADDELEEREVALGKASPALEWIELDGACTSYYGRQPVALDHFFVTSTVRPLVVGRASAAGLCVEQRCEKLPEGQPPRTYRRVSDHCPVVLTLH